MSNPQQKSILFTNSPIAQLDQEVAEDYEEAAGAGGCGCFRRLSCFGWDDDDDESHNYLLRGSSYKETWLVTKLKKLKEFSELVAGPKWKNFIRKLGKVCNAKTSSKKETTQFQYSPESYALNFATYGDSEEDGELLHSFSSRFAAGALVNDQRKMTAL